MHHIVVIPSAAIYIAAFFTVRFSGMNKLNNITWTIY